MDRDQFLNWVLREHGAQVRDLVERMLEGKSSAEIADPSGLVRQALIELYPKDYEFQPSADPLPYGFCST